MEIRDLRGDINNHLSVKMEAEGKNGSLAVLTCLQGPCPARPRALPEERELSALAWGRGGEGMQGWGEAEGKEDVRSAEEVGSL